MNGESEPTLDENILQRWVGNNEQITDLIRPEICQQMAALVDYKGRLEQGDPLPPLWHWLFFHQPVVLNNVGEDGHARLGKFLPPVALPRRMWAGGRLTFQSPLRVGSLITRSTQITRVQRKAGKSGELCFVTVEHTLRDESDTKLIEEHDIVYREAAKPPTSREKSSTDDGAHTSVPNKPIRAAAALTAYDSSGVLRVTPSVCALFQYSALTFNSHRIHYDRDYCHQVEGYDGLVFHGPLTATLMADCAQRYSDRSLQSFEFKALCPVLDIDEFSISAEQTDANVSVEARKHNGEIVMQALAVVQVDHV